ncbi:MAG: FAD-dependent monooxygenase [Gammaproteobacteria bacterium]|jgi:salicylate hydroxylase
MSNYHNHIAIIGAGISGLALACILKKAQIPVVVFEKSKEISDYGAGISLSPNGIRILKRLDIFNEVVSVSANPNQASFFSNNKKINTFKVDVVTTSRQVLYKSLYKKYKSLNGDILFDHELSDVDFDNLELHFNNNQVYKIAHIAACDGIKSLCRKKTDQESEPIYSGYSVWRAVVEKKQNETKTFLGPNHHIVTYPISNSKISFVAAIKTNRKYRESWRTEGTYAQLKEDLYLSNIDSYSFINEDTSLFKWGVYIRPMIKNLKYKNLTLLGDAAHPIVPFIGQGGCLALEDAYVFGNLLIKYDSDFCKAQNIYELIRKKRIKTVMNLSLRQGSLNHISNPVIVFFRNLVMKYLPSLAIRPIKIKVWDYDPELDIRNFD